MKDIKTSWNLNLLYKSHTDPQIEKDVRAIEAAYSKFEKKWKGKTDYLKKEAKLFEALNDFEGLFKKLRITAPISYFSFAQDLNAKDDIARATYNQLLERFAKNEHKIVFFELSLAKIPAPLQKKFLASKKLAHFRYYLHNVFRRAKHDLSEPEEKILGLKAIPAYSHWRNLTEKVLGNATIEWRAEQLPLPKAVSTIADLPLPDRYELHERVMKKFAEFSDIAEAELNAIGTDKKINDGLRGFDKAYDATILSYQNDRKSVLALIDAVTKAFPISHRFYKLKAKLLGLQKLRYPDRQVGIGKNVKAVPFPEALKTVRDVFGSVHPRFREILDSYLKNGQIDVFPKVGKTGGAYCAPNVNAPTFVLLNHTDSFSETMTLAHEMGHAIHTDLATESQTPLYQGYSIAAAEVASTLFESFVFDAVFETLSDDEKIVALHKRLNDDISTIFRQVACFNFETEFHEILRAKGGLSSAEIASLMNKHMAAYLGPAVEMRPEDGNFFVYWSHIRQFFYVYSYAFGQLISSALYARYKKDKAFLTEIEKFLRAGSSASPEDIFKSIGIDVTKPSFWQEGLKQIEKNIEQLEHLTKSKR
ncbi:MAG TPA: M3 family oligoendopeptidase [Candidatus Paceibacterota bacterium]|jgi:Oligoendopeptidase F